MSVENEAIRLATLMFQGDGYAVSDVSHDRNHKGYDLLVARNGESLKVEVKGCSRSWHIPDPFATEFDDDKVLVADVLCVVYLTDSDKPWACLIPREAIPPDLVAPKFGYRISGKFKKESVLGPFRRDLSNLESTGA